MDTKKRIDRQVDPFLSEEEPGLCNIQPHDVVVHVESPADREIPLAQTPHAHVFIEVQGPVMTVDIQFQTTRRR